jgi:hypothetical protein
VRVQPTPSEAIEIYNPTSSAVDLSNYRIYNASFTHNPPDGGADCHYWLHDGGTCGQAFGDFDIQFPSGAMIAPGATKVIAVTGTFNFCGDGGACAVSLPDFEIPPPDGGGNPSVPDMRGVWDHSPGNWSSFGFLTNTSEDLILYEWDGTSATVTDVDYFIWGQSTSVLSDKSGVAGYQNDTPTVSQKPITASTSTSTSYQRACYNEDGEKMSGGNGITGHDETSEDLSLNWVVGPPSLGQKTPGSMP